MTMTQRCTFSFERKAVLKHDHFDELAAAASIGQASVEELLEFEQHASLCERCRLAYQEYLSLAAQHFAKAQNDSKLTRQEAYECLNSHLMTQRFLERAESRCIHFSSEVGRGIDAVTPQRVRLARASRQLLPRFAFAAVLLLLSVAVYRRPHVSPNNVGSSSTALSLASEAAGRGSVSSVQRADELVREKQTLLAQIEHLNNVDLRQLKEQVKLRDANLELSSRKYKDLLRERDALESEARATEQRGAEAKQQAAEARSELAGVQGRAEELEALLVDNQTKIGDLRAELDTRTAALEKARQLLLHDHDVSNLMAARNLHIVDVVDTDGRGKNQPAFGRIFFTEGKSLVFYAYDLNETKLEKTHLEYRVWAKKEGEDKQIRRLGIFFADDKIQKRWVFKCDDPKILADIDSVFVTLEAPNGSSLDPKGPQLMYAYLRGQPNHP